VRGLRNPVRAKQRSVYEEEFKRLGRRARGAVLTFLETTADLDRARATRFIEAMAMVVAFAPPRGRR
jgi:hypothetical protein